MRRNKISPLNCRLRLNWVSLCHPKSCQRLTWASICLCTSSRSSTRHIPESHRCTLRILHTRSNHLCPVRRRTLRLMVRRTTPTMRSPPIHRLCTPELRLTSIHKSRLWTLGTHIIAILRQRRPVIPHTLPLLKRNYITHHPASLHIRLPLYLQPHTVATNPFSITITSRRRCRRFRPAQCQRLHSSTRAQLQSQAMRSQALYSPRMTTEHMGTAWNLNDDQSMGALLRSTIHRFTWDIEALRCLFAVFFRDCLHDVE